MTIHVRELESLVENEDEPEGSGAAELAAAMPWIEAERDRRLEARRRRDQARVRAWHNDD